MKVASLAAVLLDFQVARESVEGSFVLDAEAAHAVEEEGLLGIVVVEVPAVDSGPWKVVSFDGLIGWTDRGSACGDRVWAWD